MTDDLTTRLRTAGDLLDARGSQKLDEAVDGDARILNIASIAPARGRRGQGALAAAAVVLVMALVAAVTWSSGAEEIGLAAGGETVAFVPSEGIGEWATLQTFEETITPMEYEAEAVVVVPAGGVGTDRMADAAAVAVLPRDWLEPAEPQPDDEVLSGSGLEGRLNLESGPRAILTTLPLDGIDGQVAIQVTAREDMSVDEMFALAALVDPGTPVEDQTFDGWDVMAGYNSSRVGGVARTFTMADTEAPVPADRWMWGATMTGVDDSAIWVLHEPYNAEVTEVRGKDAWISVEGDTVTVTWTEAPGVIVQVSAGSASGDATLVADALAVAEDLVAADQSAWEQFADQATAEPPVSSPTTEEPRLPPPLPDEAADADEVISGELDSGGWFHLWIDRDEEWLCWEVHRDSGGEAACEYLAPIGTHQKITTTDGVVHLIAGIMPEGAEFVEVSTDRGSIDLDVSGVLWAAPVPPGQTPETVVYLDADREPVESVVLGTGAGGDPPG